MMKYIYRKLLYKFYSKRRPDFLTEYQKIKKIKSEPKPNGTKNVIVAPFSFGNNHLFEAIYARKCKLEGINVHAFLCGQGVDYCEEKGNGVKFNKIKCEICFQMQHDFANQFGVQPCFVGRELNKQDKIMIANYTSDYFENESNPPFFLGVNVQKVLLSALQRHYLEADPDMIRNKITVGFIETILSTIIIFDRLCTRVNPEYVLVSHGTYSSWGGIVEYCKAKEIPVVVWGRVYNKWGIYFANNESYLTERVTGSNEEWLNKELTVKQEKLIINFFEMRTGKNNQEFMYDYNKNQKRQLSKDELCAKLNIPSDAQIVGMFPNIPWDGSVSGVSEAFSSYKEWLSATIDFFREKEDIYLLIRTHPAEKAIGAVIGNENLQSLINQLNKSLPNNVIVISADSEINSFSVGEASSFGVFYCSTAGMELTYLGVPLICAGPSPLRNKGIVYDSQSRAQYLEFLELGIKNELNINEQMKRNLLKFSYYNVFTRVMPETFVEFEEGIFNRLLFNDEKMIKENEVLDHLFKTISNKDNYNFDSFYS